MVGVTCWILVNRDQNAALALANRFRRPQRPHRQELARAVAANRPALVTSDMSALRM